MTDIKLLYLSCNLNDEKGEDEIFIKLGKRKIWPSAFYNIISPGQKTKMDITLRLPNDESTALELWDHDFFSKNDLLGTFTLNLAEISPNVKITTFLDQIEPSDTDSYELEWEIICRR